MAFRHKEISKILGRLDGIYKEKYGINDYKDNMRAIARYYSKNGKELERLWYREQ